MAEYARIVHTDRGDFTLRLDRPPKDDAELAQLAEEAAASAFGPVEDVSTHGGVPRGTPIPAEAEPGLLQTFLGTAGNELATGAQQVYQGAVGAPGAALRLLRATVARNPLTEGPGNVTEPAGTLAQTPLGALRLLNAVPVAAGRTAGEATLDVTGSPAAATAADIGTTLLTSYGAGKAVNAGVRAFRKQVVPRLPGAGTALREAGTEEVRTLAPAVLPTTPSDQLYAVVETMNPSIDLPRYNRAAKEIFSDQQTAARWGIGDAELMRLSQKGAKASAQAVPFQEVRDLRRSLGELIESERRTGGPKLGSLKRAFAALSEDLEAGHGVAARASAALKAANAAARREFHSGEIDDIVENGIIKGMKEGSEAITPPFKGMAREFAKKFRDDTRFAESFKPGEAAAMQGTLEELGNIPIPAVPKGANFGSGKYLGGGAAVDIAGQKLFGTPPGVVGTAAVGAHFIISKALQTATGRKLLVYLAKAPGGLSDKSIAALAAFARAQPPAQNE